jgi:hypothetical protein
VCYIGSAALYGLGFILSTVRLPAWRAHEEEVKLVTSLMEDMLRCYSELESDGPISARHILELLRATTNKGVISGLLGLLPSMLFWTT